MDMHVDPAAAHLEASLSQPAPEAEPLVCLSDSRLDELMRWHGTDERNLPPAATLKNLARDTVAALHELQRARAIILELRSAMGRAFWATEFDQVHAILLRGLGPPPDDLDS